MQYEEIKQQKLREDSVLKSLQEANERGEVCPYSEEQILEAQKQWGKKQLNYIYNELINPTANALLYFISILITLVLMPTLYLKKDNVSETVAFMLMLLFMVLIILIVIMVECSFQKDTEKKREWIKYFSKFANDTYGLGYLLTALGYLIYTMGPVKFWFVCGAIIVAFLVAVYYDFLKPIGKHLNKLRKKVSQSVKI